MEELRRGMLDRARAYGFELVVPPLLEHLESLLSGTGHELDLRTFKLVDQLSGRTLGVRADTTPQVARIDAHLLNRQGIARLCYCGPVLHTKPQGLHATREPLQFGAEIYGHAGLEADLEVAELALDCLVTADLSSIAMDLADARIVRGVLAGVPIDAAGLGAVAAALASKDAAGVHDLSRSFPADARAGLIALLNLYGGPEVLDRARAELPQRPMITAALNDLEWLSGHLQEANANVRIGFDLADLSGYAYYSGTRFAVYAAGISDVVLRGGRYDEVGSVFGRNRPAVGFSLDLKTLASAGNRPVASAAAIRAPWGLDPKLRGAIRQLRAQGEIVVCALPGHEHEVQEFDCDRELVGHDGQWAVRPLPSQLS
ncbi:ATP phosphoribosyltransferase regulatory subunit [soil metagenome]